MTAYRVIVTDGRQKTPGDYILNLCMDSKTCGSEKKLNIGLAKSLNEMYCKPKDIICFLSLFPIAEMPPNISMPPVALYRVLTLENMPIKYGITPKKSDEQYTVDYFLDGRAYRKKNLNSADLGEIIKQLKPESFFVFRESEDCVYSNNEVELLPISEGDVYWPFKEGWTVKG